jgi:ubiquinone/menaquinone biosynthesis C-methylase UbiE
MEIREILKRLQDGDRILDVGCANGYSTVQFAAARRVVVRGVDYVPEMIRQARLRVLEIGDRLLGSVGFEVGNILALDEPPEAYDKVVVVRVIINLADWDHQQRGLRECARVLKPGGLLLLSEATVQGWRRLNQFRAEWGLTEIPIPSFNCYLDQDRVVEALAPDLELLELSDFASSYYVSTRVLKPLLIHAVGASVDVADPNMEWNRWSALLPPVGDYGTQKLFVFRRR